MKRYGPLVGALVGGAPARPLRSWRTHCHGYLLPGMRISQHNAKHDTHDTLVEHRFHKLHDALVEHRFHLWGLGAGAGGHSWTPPPILKKVDLDREGVQFSRSPGGIQSDPQSGAPGSWGCSRIGGTGAGP